MKTNAATTPTALYNISLSAFVVSERLFMLMAHTGGGLGFYQA